MPTATNAQLSLELSTFLTLQGQRERELRDWQSGASDGGPFLDGTYPITDFTGATLFYKSPARLAADVDNAVSGALAHKVSAETAQAAAEAALVQVNTVLTTVNAHLAQIVIYKDMALAAETSAANHSAAANTAKVAAEAARDATIAALAEWEANNP